MTYIPVYKQITEWLRTVVAQRDHGAMLPTISEVQQRFGINGVQTVRRAYNTLINEGLVVRKDSPRRYFVVNPNAAEGSTRDITALVTELKTVLARATVLVEELENAA